MNAAVRAAGYEVEICAPYLDKPKAWIGGMAQQMGVRPNEIWTCYKGGAEPCGECPACVLRAKGYVGFSESLNKASPPAA